MLKKLIILISSTLPALAMEEFRPLLDYYEARNGAVHLNSHTSSGNQISFLLPLLDTALNFDGITPSQSGNPYLGAYPSAYSLQDGSQLLPHPFYDPSHLFWEGTLFSKNTPDAAQEIFGSSALEFDVDAFLDFAAEGAPHELIENGQNSQDLTNMINALTLACKHSHQEYLMPGSSNLLASAYQRPSISMPPSTLRIDALIKRQ